VITSIQNQKIQSIRALLEKPHARQAKHSYVIEGVRLGEEALASGCKVESVLYISTLSKRGQELVEKFSASGTVIEEVSPHIMDSLSKTEKSQGLLAVVPIHTPTLPSLVDFVVVADGIRDPGNLGSLIRTCVAAGVQGLILTPGTVDVYAPKVVRSAMGAHFHLPILALGWTEIYSLLLERKNFLHIYLTDAEQGQSFWEVDLRQPLALLIGGEAEGASSSARHLAESIIHIPMPGGSESLNAAIAAGILIFEVIRQRSLVNLKPSID